MRSTHQIALSIIAALCLTSGPAPADESGFQLNRYEPTPAGTWTLAVDHPWYSSTRWFAAALTLDYGHNPLVYGVLDAGGGFARSNAVVAHQLVGHVDLAASFLDRIQLSLSLPITLGEWGDALPGIAAPIGGAAVGDPRIGVMARLWQQPDDNAVSLHLGAQLWIPIGAQANHAGDSGIRLLPKLVLAGMTFDHLRWSASAGYLIRPSATFANNVANDGNSSGHELQFAGAVQYTNSDRTWAVGPELLLASTPTGGHFFDGNYTSFEALLGGHYLFARQLLAGVSVGMGAGHSPGTPDFRFLARLAWAPTAERDRDGDGVPDRQDACPDVKGPRTSTPATNGCPSLDRDQDGVVDAEDLCPDVPQGDHPDALHRGCPVGDRDLDGIPDSEDRCPEVPQGAHPDANRRGCPAPDADHDGVPDTMDVCPNVPQGQTPDLVRPGCPIGPAPAADRDHDGVADSDDACPDVPAGMHPDPVRSGCPAPDRDGDSVPDAADACPDQPGAPDTNPQKNGCPGLVTIKSGKIAILVPVFFATDKDVILPKSFPVLSAVAKTLRVESAIRRVAIEGHTDSRGKREHNIDLSDRRARSVMRWLSAHGIAEERLSAKGYGPLRPIASNATGKGRAANRRVDFVIVDPAPTPSGDARPAPTPAKGKSRLAPKPRGKHRRLRHR